MLVNIIGGMQSLVDQVLVGHIVGFTGNAAIGVSNQVFIAVFIFITSLFTGMSVLVSRFAGAGDADKVNRTVYQACITAVGHRAAGDGARRVFPRARRCSTSSTPRPRCRRRRCRSSASCS